MSPLCETYSSSHTLMTGKILLLNFNKCSKAASNLCCRLFSISGVSTLFPKLTKTQLFVLFVSIVALRIAVGFHFFKEGTNKLKYGFNAYGFLSGAKGPLAPAFKGMLNDSNGMTKLCVSEILIDGERSFEINTKSTIKAWKQFEKDAITYFGLGSVDLQLELSKQRQKLAEQIEEARSQNNTEINTTELADKRKSLESAINQIRNQPKLLKETLDTHIELLKEWATGNRVELIAHFSTEDRLNGFARDGQQASAVSLEVDSLRGQIDTIASDRNKKLAGWTKETTDMWDSLETKINSLPVVEQRGETPLALNRPFNPKFGGLNLINMVIPWFDTVVGVCLIVGLFTRFASLSAGLFLLSVCLTQPFWVPGTNPTYLYWIEMTACFVIFGTLAGRMAGLDYIINGFFTGGETASSVEH